MRTFICTVALVAAFCIVELFVLFALAVPAKYPRAGPQEGVTFCLAVLSIPFLGALFLRFTYGDRKWAAQAMATVVVSTAGWIAFAAIVIGESEVVTEQHPKWLTALTVVDALLLLGVMAFLWRRLRQRSVALEIANWTAQRQRGRAEHHRRSQAIRVALCLPVASVLLALLFLPTVWGVVSHILHPAATVLGGYRLDLPASWVVLEAGDNLVFGAVASSPLQSPARWLRYGEVPISRWDFSVHPGATSDGPPSEHRKTVLERRSFDTRRGPINCIRYWPDWVVQQDPAYAFVTCSGPDGFRAYLYGGASPTAAFYGVIESVARSH